MTSVWRLATVVVTAMALSGCGFLFSGDDASDAGSVDAAVDGGCAKPCGTTCCEGNLVCNQARLTCDQPCQPACIGKQCGPDGCGGSCGSCGSGKKCDPGAGVCNPCVPDCAGKDCGDDGCGGTCKQCPGGQTCSMNKCVACTPNCAGKSCGNDGCGGQCGTCGPGTMCNASGICAGCSSDNDCSGNPNGPRCNLLAGKCVGCLGDSDCSNDGTVTCDLNSHTCNATCAMESDCSAVPGAPHCDNGSGKCVGCRSSGDCTGTTSACDLSTHTCAVCASDTDCQNAGTGQYCKNKTACVQCLSNTDCFGQKCDLQTNTCAECTSEGDCAGKPSTPHCDVSAKRCVACRTGSDCSSTTPVCTSAKVCVQCTGDSDCSNRGTTKRCYTATSTCVECLAGADCASGTCQTNHTCQATASGPENCSSVQTVTLSNGMATVSGSLSGKLNDTQGSCGGSSGPDLVYALNVPSTSNVDVQVSASGYTPVFYVRGGGSTCATSTSELGCVVGSGGAAAKSFANVPAGTYYFWIDSSTTTGGNFTIQVAVTPVTSGGGGTCASPNFLNISPTTGRATANGTTVGQTNANSSANCGTGASAGEVVYAFSLSTAKTVTFTLSTTSSTYVPSMYLRTSCSSDASEVDCTYASGTGGTATMSDNLSAGSYFIIVDGDTSAMGAFTLTLDTGGGNPTTETNCTDFIDNDADGQTDCFDSDCAFDPACQTTSSCTPTTGSGADSCSSSCRSLSFVGGRATASGSTAGNTANSTQSCGGAGLDVVYQVVVPTGYSSLGLTVTSSTTGYQPAVSIVGPSTTCLASTSTNTRANCASGTGSGASATYTASVTPGTYWVWVDSVGTATSSGSYTLSAVLGGGSTGTETSCADFFDNDGDGLTDCDDPDCATSTACGSTGGGQGADGCSGSVPALSFSNNVATASGTTQGYLSDGTQSCGGSGSDVVYSLVLPSGYSSLTLKVVSNSSTYQPVVSLVGPASFCTVSQSTNTRCGAAGVTGSGQTATYTATGLTSGTYYVWVDSYSSSYGNYTLTVTRQ